MVLNVVKKIKKGKVSTYKEIAKAVERPRAYRAVGSVLKKNKDPKRIPCYRVVKSDGSVGEYSLGVRRKIQKLKNDGIEIKNGKINLKKYLQKANELS